jgi:tetratricopeptide (TPR) repeat protein
MSMTAKGTADVGSRPADTAKLKRGVIIAAIVFVALVAAFAVYYYRDRYVAQGVAAPKDTSLQLLEKKVRSDPKNVDARMALAETYLLNRNYKDAIAQSTQILDAYPNKERALLILGVAYSLSQQADKALPPLTKYVGMRDKGEMAGLDTTLESALYYLGDSYLQLGRPADAIKPLKRALEINGTDADALYAIGRAYAGAGKQAEAVKAFGTATALVPDYADVYKAMAASYTTLGDKDLAAYAEAMVAFSTKDYESARTQLAAVVLRREDFAPAFLGLALAQEKLGDLQKALASLQQAQKIDPNDLGVQQALGRVTSALQE